METTIDLENFRTKGSKVFTGRPRGEQVRTDSKVNELATKFDKIIVIIPENIYSVNPSFLEEFLKNVVQKLGEDKFYTQFQFICKGEYQINRDLGEAVGNILKEENALV